MTDVPSAASALGGFLLQVGILGALISGGVLAFRSHRTWKASRGLTLERVA